MKSIGHAIWHPFRHFRWLRWSLNNGAWLVITLALLAAIGSTLSALGHDTAATVVFDLFVVRGICFVVETLLDRVPDENFCSHITDGDTDTWETQMPSIARLGPHGVTPLFTNLKSRITTFIS